MDVVERYSLLNLTKESDRLPALAGLAQHLFKAFFVPVSSRNVGRRLGSEPIMESRSMARDMVV
jgi:hypothetical protein